jgi:chromosome segregation and condensation protein ScpB
VTWTMKDLREAVRLRRAGWTYPRIGRLLGRTRRAVRDAVARHAPELVTPVPAPADFAPRLRSLHARGYSDGDLARALGLDRHTARRWRANLGLGPNLRHPRQLAKCRRGYRTVTHRYGKPSLRAVRDEVRRLRAAGAGWPEAVSPQEVEVLDLLADRGPLTGRQVDRLRGLRPDSSRRVLQPLVRRGLVARVDRMSPRPLPSLYRLADGVGRHRTHVCHRVRGEEGVGS